MKRKKKHPEPTTSTTKLLCNDIDYDIHKMTTTLYVIPIFVPVSCFTFAGGVGVGVSLHRAARVQLNDSSRHKDVTAIHHHFFFLFPFIFINHSFFPFVLFVHLFFRVPFTGVPKTSLKEGCLFFDFCPAMR